MSLSYFLCNCYGGDEDAIQAGRLAVRLEDFPCSQVNDFPLVGALAAEFNADRNGSEASFEE